MTEEQKYVQCPDDCISSTPEDGCKIYEELPGSPELCTEDWADRCPLYCSFIDLERKLIVAATGINSKHPELVFKHLSTAVKVLARLTSPTGRYSTDPLQHANNTIEDMSKMALRILTLLGVSSDQISLHNADTHFLYSFQEGPIEDWQK